MACNRPPDIVATGPAHDLAVWHRHPDVVHAYARLLEGLPPGEFELRLWLRPGSENAARIESRQPRGIFGVKPDIQLFIPNWEPHPTFWGRLWPLKGMEMFQEMPDERAPNGWIVARLWLEPA